MANINETIEMKLLPIAAKISSNRVLTAIRDGIMLSMPLIIVGSLAMVIAYLPITAWTDWLSATGLSSYLSKISNCSFGIMSLIASFGVARSYADQLGVDGVSAGIISVSGFLILTPMTSSLSGDAASVTGFTEGLPLSYMGSSGLFVALVVGIFSALIFASLIKHNVSIKMPDAVPPAVAKSFSALLPGAIILFVWLVVLYVFDTLGFPNIHSVLATVIGTPLSLVGATLPGTILVVMLNSLFWFFGVHGGNIANTPFSPIWLANAEANLVAYQAGETLPNIITSSFMDNFVFMGGGGATLGLVIAISLLALRKGSSKTTKTMAPLVLTPGIFNINEPALFGLPIVMNVSMLIPFMLVPAINVVVCYFAMSSGIVPLTTGVVASWTMPPIISGFITTNSILGSLLQAVCICIDAAVYLPFYLVVEKQNLANEREQEKLTD